MRMLERKSRFLRVDRIAQIIADLPQSFRASKFSAKRLRDLAAFYQILVECLMQAAVRFSFRDFRRGCNKHQCRARGIEHRIIGAVAGTLGIIFAEQNIGLGKGAIGFFK
jgi:uncharacterized protein YecE (DUF72 family)